MTARCGLGAPSVIEVAPLVDDYVPFPTSWWLTCPALVAMVADVESAGGCSRWSRRIAVDAPLTEEVLAADLRYREARAALAGGVDPCAGLGVAGQRDPLAVKCLHARVAAHMGGPGDPIGAGVLDPLPRAEHTHACDVAGCTVARDVARAR